MCGAWVRNVLSLMILSFVISGERILQVTQSIQIQDGDKNGLLLRRDQVRFGGSSPCRPDHVTHSNPSSPWLFHECRIFLPAGLVSFTYLSLQNYPHKNAVTVAIIHGDPVKIVLFLNFLFFLFFALRSLFRWLKKDTASFWFERAKRGECVRLNTSRKSPSFDIAVPPTPSLPLSFSPLPFPHAPSTSIITIRSASATQRNCLFVSFSIDLEPAQSALRSGTWYMGNHLFYIRNHLFDQIFHGRERSRLLWYQAPALRPLLPASHPVSHSTLFVECSVARLVIHLFSRSISISLIVSPCFRVVPHDVTKNRKTKDEPERNPYPPPLFSFPGEWWTEPSSEERSIHVLFYVVFISVSSHVLGWWNPRPLHSERHRPLVALYSCLPSYVLSKKGCSHHCRSKRFSKK